MLSTDEELVLRIKKGEISAFEELVNRYEPKLIGYVMKKVKEVKDAEEVVQDGFVKVYRNIGRIDHKRRFASYLYTVIDHEVVDFYRRRKWVLPLFDEVIGDGENEMLEKIHREDEKKRVREKLDKLPENHKKTLWMYYFEELSYKKIAEKLRMPINSVKTNIKRAKESLYKLMKNETKGKNY